MVPRFWTQIKSSGLHPTMIMLKTSWRDGVIWEEEINSKKAVLKVLLFLFIKSLFYLFCNLYEYLCSNFFKISDGYPCYNFDSKLNLNLSDIFVSDGKWHQLEVSWEPTRLVLSADYKKYKREALLYQSSSSQKMISVGGQDKEKFIGCLFGKIM